MKTIVLFSGGLDSTTALYVARSEGREPICLTIHYGQLHEREITSAKKIAVSLRLEHWIIPLSLPWGGSALTDSEIALPKGRSEKEISKEIPVTYVPARNSIFLSLAASLAETKEADSIYFGANALDYSGYPDCRPAFLEAFEELIARGTKAGSEGKKIRIIAPLLYLSKAEIVRLGYELKVPFEWTWSCYEGRETPCGECDSCILRAKGFREAGIEDPLMQTMRRA
ncbi:MAG: 7-cyano-7-deazaguanine synthase QueC [Candidatus Omnitrophica bacterium]|nr:7-cyano-7-deazaguanine synthase QueC [Candidatus Omnitrophota bacterium]